MEGYTGAEGAGLGGESASAAGVREDRGDLRPPPCLCQEGSELALVQIEEQTDDLHRRRLGHWDHPQLMEGIAQASILRGARAAEAAPT